MSASGFVWYELMTTDTPAAKAFYGHVVGWGAQAAPMPGVDYTLFTTGTAQIAGLMALPEEARRMGAPPGWIGYVGVADVDAMAVRVKGLGGTQHVAPTDIPGVGRFAVVADPQGATVALFAPQGPIRDRSFQMGVPGRIGWNELWAADWKTAFPFYAELFGWTKSEAVDIGEMGTYQTFASGGQPTGGMFDKPAMVPACFWLFYFNVADIDAGAARVQEAGGKVVNGPMEVPGGGWILQGMDPQGAMFALFGQRVT